MGVQALAMPLMSFLWALRDPEKMIKGESSDENDDFEILSELFQNETGIKLGKNPLRNNPEFLTYLAEQNEVK